MIRHRHGNNWAWVLIGMVMVSAKAANLPENRADIMFHSYSGDDVTVTGPALLIRQDMLETFSAHASYYVDAVTSASVDVRTVASKFTDERRQLGLGLDYLYKDAIIGISYSNSEEEDYDADTLDVSVTHETLGGMTSINLGYTRGWDTVGKVNDVFSEDISRNNYRVSLAQVLTPTLLLSVGYEGVTDDGFLNNPYRPVRLFGVFGAPERYPRTHASHAVSLKGVKMLGTGNRRPTLNFGYRYYFDTWDIQASTYSLAYSMYLSDLLLLDLHGRYYQQGAASFYRDNFLGEFNFMARDKELSTFSDYSLGVKVSYELGQPFGFIDRASFNVSYDFIFFNYDDFRDYSSDPTSGELLKFTAGVAQIFFSAWY